MTHKKSNHECSPGYERRVLPAGLSRPAGYIAKGVAAASVTGLIAMSAPASKAEAATPAIQPQARNGNPLTMPVSAGCFSRPALADIDADGDLDMFIGGNDGHIQYFSNAGSTSAPDFRLQYGEDNPFWWYDSGCDDYFPYDVGYLAAPTFADLDNDGDLDAVVGSGEGALHYFQNDGTASAPEMTQQPGTANPFDSLAVGTYADSTVPALVDIDNDGDLDLFVADEDYLCTIYYFENNGTASAPNFAATPQTNPMGLYSTDAEGTIIFADIDNDGDPDAFMGSEGGEVHFFKNVGDAWEADFALQGAEGGAPKFVVPMAGIDVGSFSAPALGDIDGDGDLDAFVGGSGQYNEYDSRVFFFENSGNAANPAFTQIFGTNSPTWGVDVGNYSKPAFADIDGDGDPDAFVGGEYGRITFYSNTGDAENPAFGVAATGGANPFDGVDVDWNAAPAFADVDGDGDLDAFIGNDDGELLYYENMGTTSAPDFVRNDAENPFTGVDVDRDATPVFADFDNDGDLDALVGEDDGYLNYFENATTASDAGPVFTWQSGTANPFDGVNVGQNSAPAAADFDGDDDVDVLIGNSNGNIYYYENTTTDTDTAPVFTQNTDYEEQDMGFLESVEHSAPTFVDIDGDGDMDIFLGEKYGRMLFVENREIVRSDAARVPVGSSSSSDTCFIDSTGADREEATGNRLSSPFSTLKNIYQKVVSRLR